MKKITRYYKKIIFNFKKKIDVDKNILNFNSLDDIFNYYGTDKGTNVKNQYDKNSNLIIGHGFAKYYEKYFEKFKNEKFKLFEIGTWEGASSAAFTIYLPNAEIYGIDRNFKFKYKSKRINFFNCDLTNKDEHKNLMKKISSKTFKIIIDDGSHILSHIIKNLKHFFSCLDNNGYYIIEDFNAPIYYDYLNDNDGNEISINDILSNIKDKKYFKSKILSKEDQNYLFENIINVDIYKGNLKESDIAFLKKR